MTVASPGCVMITFSPGGQMLAVSVASASALVVRRKRPKNGIDIRKLLAQVKELIFDVR